MGLTINFYQVAKRNGNGQYWLRVYRYPRRLSPTQNESILGTALFYLLICGIWQVHYHFTDRYFYLKYFLYYAYILRVITFQMIFIKGLQRVSYPLPSKSSSLSLILYIIKPSSCITHFIFFITAIYYLNPTPTNATYQSPELHGLYN